MRIAILGAGFAGLAVTWYLLHYSQGSYTVDLFDPEPIGGGASGISSGLLHPYPGKQARVAWEAKRCLQETHRLLTVASQANATPLVLSKGILRPAVTEEQIRDFQIASQNDQNTEWWDKKKCEAKIPGLVLPENSGALYIKTGLTIDVKNYLHGLWQACVYHGTQFHQKAMISMADLEKYDRVVIAMGPLSKNFPALKELPISPVKGQNLILKWPENIPSLACSVISKKYIVMLNRNSCLVGSTYEHSFTTQKPEKTKAVQEIMPHIASFFPSLEKAPILSVNAAFRASTPNHLPLVGKISDKFYFFTGLGSKGLLYHAWIGKRLARAIISKDPSHFPEQIHYHLEEKPQQKS